MNPEHEPSPIAHAWSTSYTVAPRPAPDASLEVVMGDTEVTATLSSEAPLGMTTVTLLDHHRDPIASRAARSNGEVTLHFPTPSGPVGGVHLKIGRFEKVLIPIDGGHIQRRRRFDLGERR